MVNPLLNGALWKVNAIGKPLKSNFFPENCTVCVQITINHFGEPIVIGINCSSNVTSQRLLSKQGSNENFASDGANIRMIFQNQKRTMECMIKYPKILLKYAHIYYAADIILS